MSLRCIYTRMFSVSFLEIIRDIGGDVLLATHSSEIIAEADPAVAGHD